MVAMDGDGEGIHSRLEEKQRVETEPMVHPGQVDMLEGTARGNDIHQAL